MMMTEFINVNAGTPGTLVNNTPQQVSTLAQTRAPRLRFRTAADIANDTPQSVPWIVEGWVAEGSITEVDGKVKLAGKTTFLLAMSRKVLDGHLFDQSVASARHFWQHQGPCRYRRRLSARLGAL